MSDSDRIGSPEFVREVARRMDPLAFTNRNKRDKAKRLRIVYARIRAALDDYGHREHDEYAGPYAGGIRDEDIPW